MPRQTRPLALAAALAAFAIGPAQAQADPGVGLAGAYLAARAASLNGDHRAAARHFEQALAADPANGFLIGNAIYARAALGDWDRAAQIAKTLDADGPGREIADLARLVEGLGRDDVTGARAAIEAGHGPGPLIDDLVLGWIQFDTGDLTAAAAAFESVAASGGISDIAHAHLGLARVAAGDFEGAEAVFSGAEFGPIAQTERILRARALILEQTDRRDAAVALLSEYTQAVPDPSLLALQARIAGADAPPPYDFIVTARQGVAEAFFNVAGAIGAEGGSGALPLLYAQAAHWIDAEHDAARLLAGRLFADGGQHALAAETFARVPPESDHYPEAQMGRASAIFETGDMAAATDVLQDLADAHPDLPSVHAALGDMLRRTENCAEAIPAYGRALDSMDATRENAWFVFYARAICHEEIDDWPPAEADFRRALELKPDQPNVLNYLGYSLVEQRRNLDEALAMIQRAVAGRPESGYITDSLGWVLYRLGRFDEAVEPMERAVALEPNDPIINDHLGDVYWMVGRYREAEFQWRRALSFEPEAEEADRIRRKLATGLYEVLEAEGGVGAIR